MKRLLIVIDMQNDFIGGELGTDESRAILSEVGEKIKKCLMAGYEIIFTRDTHYDNYLDTHEGRSLPVTHCIKDTEGWQISEMLDTSSAKIIDKTTFGSFELADYVAESVMPEQIEIIGICTDICLISNAIILKARLPETIITVDAKCCAGTTPQNHLNALNVMKTCHIQILNGED